MSYKGKFRPSNRKKYRGDITKIVYRSLWERKFMVYCDTNPDIVEWGSEEIIIPYISPESQRDSYTKLMSGAETKLNGKLQMNCAKDMVGNSL